MRTDRVDGKSKQCQRRGGLGGAVAVGLCALAGATALIAPPAASAMTSEQMASICASVFSSIGDPSICAENFLASSGPGGSIAIDLPDGSILVLAAKPDLNRVSCGSGIDARRPADCNTKPRDHQGTGFLQGKEPPPVEPPLSRSRGEQRRTLPEGSLKKCVLARMTKEEYPDAVKFIRNLLKDPNAWEAGGSNLTFKAGGPFFMRKEQWIKWFPNKMMDALQERFPEARSGSHIDEMRMYLAGWEMLKKEVEKDLDSPTCSPFAVRDKS